VELDSVFPVPGSALQMGDGDDHDLMRADAIDDLVRKTGQEKPAGLLIVRQRIPGLRIQCQPFKGPADLVQQLGPKATAL
jgi:hypothetical protein